MRTEYRPTDRSLNIADKKMLRQKMSASGTIMIAIAPSEHSDKHRQIGVALLDMRLRDIIKNEQKTEPKPADRLPEYCEIGGCHFIM